MIPSTLIQAEGDEEADIPEEEVEEGEEGVVKNFKKGICVNVERILKEFCKINNLKPLKIFVTGPTDEKLKVYSDQLGGHYRIPYISVSNILAKAPEQKENFLAVDYEADKALIDGYLEKGVALDVKNYSKKKLPDYLKTLYKLVKNRLQQPDCKNRGFIFDGSPFNKHDIQFIFLDQKKSLLRKAKREANAK